MRQKMQYKEAAVLVLLLKVTSAMTGFNVAFMLSSTDKKNWNGFNCFMSQR